MAVPRYGEVVSVTSRNYLQDLTGKIGLITTQEVNSKMAEASRLANPVKSGRWNINRRDW